jgi:hypothetical protein
VLLSVLIYFHPNVCTTHQAKPKQKGFKDRRPKEGKRNEERGKREKVKVRLKSEV